MRRGVPAVEMLDVWLRGFVTLPVLLLIVRDVVEVVRYLSIRKPVYHDAVDHLQRDSDKQLEGKCALRGHVAQKEGRRSSSSP